jgi:hypothetical protein
MEGSTVLQEMDNAKTNEVTANRENIFFGFILLKLPS